MGAMSFENVTSARAAVVAGVGSAARAKVCATMAINIVSTMLIAERCRGFKVAIIRVAPRPIFT
jgi:hypothetical protein